MKRYVIFAGDTFYPGGGWDDFHSWHDTIEEAIEAAKTVTTDWWDCIDLTTGERVVLP